MKSIILIITVLTINGFAQLAWNSKETIQCVDKLVTGFRWQNSEYKQSNYEGQKYFIKRLDNKQCNPQKLTNTSIHLGRSKGCYSIQRNTTNHEGSTKICTETLKYDSYKQKNYIVEVECSDGVVNNIRFQPNGNYILFYGMNKLDNNPKNGRKNSIYISVGTCSIMRSSGVTLRSSND